jgi:2-hydroxychromene-2-carboxylate isomerase
MANPIVFYFDFASPYAYMALDGIEAIGRRANRPVEWRPVLVWAVLKALKVAPPMDTEAKRHYLLMDMQRSANFLGVPYRQPSRLPASAHLATRLYLSVAEQDEAKAKVLGLDIFRAFFVEDRDITDAGVVAGIAARHGIDADAADMGMTGPRGRALLSAMIDRALADGVIGSPYFIIDGEPFFGADRLPQITWRLSQ